MKEEKAMRCEWLGVFKSAATMHLSALTGKVENKAAVSFQLEDSLTPSTNKTINTTPHPNSNRGGCLIITIMHMKMCMPIPFHCVCVCVYDVIILISDFTTGISILSSRGVLWDRELMNVWIWTWEFSITGQKKEIFGEWVFATEESSPGAQVAETHLRCSSLRLTGLIQTSQPWIHIY